MSKIVFFLLLSFLLVGATPVSDHGALSVKNGVVVDKNGKPPQLRGMSLFWNIYPEGSKYFNSTAIGQLATNWKTDVIRAAIGNTSSADAKTIIDAAITNGVYVIVDWHYHTAMPTEAKAFFTDVSAYVKNKGNPPNVIYEIWNEPTIDTWSPIKTYADQVIPSIRGNSPAALVIVGTPKYSSMVDAALADPLTGTNIAYAFHFYASESGHRNYKYRALNAICNDLPVFVTEWGTSKADGGSDPTLNWTWIKEWVSFLENNKLSWANWSIADKAESSAALVSGTTPSQMSTSGNLTASGTYLKTLISTLSTTGKHPDISSSSYACPSSSSFSRTGKGSIGTDIAFEAENYVDTLGVTQVDGDATAHNSMYLSGYGTGDYSNYLITNPSVKDTILIMVMYVRGGAGSVTYTSAGKTVNATIPASTTWKSVWTPVMFKSGEQSLRFDFSSANGNVDFDYFTFVAADSSDTVNYGLKTWKTTGVKIQADRTTSPLRAIHSGNELILALGSKNSWTSVEAFTTSGQPLEHWDIQQGQTELALDQGSLPQGIVLFRANGTNLFSSTLRVTNIN